MDLKRHMDKQKLFFDFIDIYSTSRDKSRALILCCDFWIKPQ